MEEHMNKCEQTQFRILEGVPLSPEEQAHLETCPECRRFAAFAGKAGRVVPAEKEIPAFLDAAVLDAARAAIPKHNWTPVVWKVVLSAAAVFVLAAGILFVQPSGPSVADGGRARGSGAAEFALNQDRAFEDQLFALASDVGTGADCFTDTIDLVI